jgi:hypothetical protein
MLDGCIDTQGAIKDLRNQGGLDSIKQELAIQVQQALSDLADAAISTNGNEDGAKKPRELVQEERREIGGVKWSIYNMNLKFLYHISHSSVSGSQQCWPADFRRIYFLPIFLDL